MNRRRIRGFLVFSTLWRFTWGLTQFTCFSVPDIFHLAEPPSSNSKCFAIYLVKNYSNLTRPHPKWWLRKGNPLLQGNLAWWNFMFSWCSFIAHVVLHMFCFFFGVKTVKRIPCLRNPDPAVFNTNQYFGVSHGVATEPTRLDSQIVVDRETRNETTFRRPRNDDMKSLKPLPSN